MARLFVAADLPDRVRDALSSAAVPGRRVPARSLHVTLCFLGEVADPDVHPVQAVVASGWWARPVRVALGEVIWLPSRRPRVCAVSLVSEDLATLQGTMARALAASARYEPERRPFLAHVTVSRLRGERPVDVALPALEPFAVPSVTLYRSWPGARYEALASAALPASG